MDTHCYISFRCTTEGFNKFILKKLKREMPYDPVMVLDIYPKKVNTLKPTLDFNSTLFHLPSVLEKALGTNSLCPSPSAFYPHKQSRFPEILKFCKVRLNWWATKLMSNQADFGVFGWLDCPRNAQIVPRNARQCFIREHPWDTQWNWGALSVFLSNSCSFLPNHLWRWSRPSQGKKSYIKESLYHQWIVFPLSDKITQSHPPLLTPLVLRVILLFFLI